MALTRMFFVATLLWSFQLDATIVRIDDISKMAENSDVVAHIVVGEQIERFDAFGRLGVYSSVEVIQGIKGLKTGQVTTVFQGSGVMGQSRFERGEELVLFGMKYDDDTIVTYGVGLGKFKVFRDRRDTKVVEDFHDVLTLAPGPKGLRFTRPIPRKYPSLTTFVSSIEEAIHAPLRVIRTGPKSVRVRQ